jgi:phage terminase Nu1 subunit (DNA packaging protein)
MSARWVSLNQLAAETGLAVRTIQYIRAQEPSVLVTRQGKSMEYKQPDCAVNLRKREADKAVADANPGDLDTARTRKANAEAELAEIDVAKARGEVVSVADYEAALARVLDRLTARLRAMPVRLAHLGTEAELAAETEAERIVVELSTFDEDVIDEPEPAKVAA